MSIFFRDCQKCVKTCMRIWLWKSPVGCTICELSVDTQKLQILIHDNVYSMEMFGLNSLSFQGPDPISLPGCCASSGDRPWATCFGYIFMYSEARFSRNSGLANLIGTRMVLASTTSALWCS